MKHAITPFALVGYDTGYSQLGATRLVGYFKGFRLAFFVNLNFANQSF